MGYPSELTDSQWDQIRGFFEGENRGKHLCKHSKRELMNGVLYVVKTGCQWRQLPHDFPPYTTVWNFYRRARIKAVWDKMLAELVKTSRIAAGRGEMPTYALIDFQSVKTTDEPTNAALTEEKNKRAKAAHRNGYHGAFACCDCSRYQYSRYGCRWSGFGEGA